MKSKVQGIVITLAILVTGYMFLLPQTSFVSTQPPSLLAYANDAYGISFSYPAGYILSEEDRDTPTFKNHRITLIKEEDAVPVIARLPGTRRGAGGEGPVSVVIDISEDTGRTLPYTDVLEVVKSSTATNFHLGDGSYSHAKVAGTDALQYQWSGLYEGETTALIHRNKYQIFVSVTYLSPGDPITAAYQTVLTTLNLR